MKVRKPEQLIETSFSHTVKEDEVTGELEITEVELKFKGPLSEWLQEYLQAPTESKLHENLVRAFRDWFK